MIVFDDHLMCIDYHRQSHTIMFSHAPDIWIFDTFQNHIQNQINIDIIMQNCL